MKPDTPIVFSGIYWVYLEREKNEKKIFRKRAQEVEKIFSRLNERDTKARIQRLDEAYHILKKI